MSISIGDIVSYGSDLYEYQLNGVVTNIIYKNDHPNNKKNDDCAIIYWFDKVGLITIEPINNLIKLT
jgi:hypothetical protein